MKYSSMLNFLILGFLMCGCGQSAGNEGEFISPDWSQSGTYCGDRNPGVSETVNTELDEIRIERAGTVTYFCRGLITFQIPANTSQAILRIKEQFLLPDYQDITTIEVQVVSYYLEEDSETCFYCSPNCGEMLSCHEVDIFGFITMRGDIVESDIAGPNISQFEIDVSPLLPPAGGVLQIKIGFAGSSIGQILEINPRLTILD